MLNRFRYLLALALCAAALPVLAASPSAKYDTLKAGPPVGAKIPHDLKTVDQNNQHRDFKALAHRRGLVILFTRSVDW